MSQRDFDKWQARYEAPSPVSEPEPFVAEVLSTLPPSGNALDVAGGLGRHALAMAAHGLHTTLLDVSPKGLELASQAATARGLRLDTVAADLDEGLPEFGPLDLVVVSWFLLTAPTWSTLCERLAPGGSLLYVQPTLHNLERHSHPSARFLVAPGDLKQQAEALGLTAQRHELGWDARGHHTERLWATKTPPIQ